VKEKARCNLTSFIIVPACTISYNRGAQPFRQVGHIERYNVLQGPEHSNISTVTNTELNITIKIA
jgi:hypothetical protein